MFTVAPTVDSTWGNLNFLPASDALGPATLTFILVDDGGTASVAFPEMITRWRGEMRGVMTSS
jgi:hypothetical protein